MECPTLGKFYEADCQKWLSTESGNELLYDLPFQEGQSFDKKAEWLCRVKTGDKRGAGTDANVYICVYGEKVCLFLHPGIDSWCFPRARHPT